MSLEKLVAEYGAFQKRQSEAVKALRINFAPLFNKLFNKHPWVESFSWRQCEPWRDGEETEFEVMCDADEIYINEENSYDDGVYGVEEKQRAFADFSEAIGEVPTEIMKALFGESNEVEVKKSGEVFVTEYNDG